MIEPRLLFAGALHRIAYTAVLLQLHTMHNKLYDTYPFEQL